MSGGGKETPRQAMIGMMYLFYTALLALNVSAEILTAFTLVDGSLRKTNSITEGMIGSAVEDFTKAMSTNPAGTKKYKDLADEVVEAANFSYSQIQHYKIALVGTLEGVYTGDYTAEYTPSSKESLDQTDASIETALRDKWSADMPDATDKNLVDIDDLVSKKDDNNVGGEIFIQKGQGQKVADQREAYRAKLIDIIDRATDNKVESSVAAKESLAKSLREMLNTNKQKSESDDVDSVDWAISNFEHLPAAGVLTLMTKMQSDVRNTESMVLSYLLNQIGKSDMKFNAIKAVVNAPSSYVLQGQEYKSEIFIAAYDSADNPEILVGGSAIPVKNGVGVYTGSTANVGAKSYNGVIKLKNKSTGEVKEYPFKGEYEVGQSSLSVSPTKMNVLYIGVPNPIEITASGTPSEKIVASISSGSLVKQGGAGNYVANVKTPGEVTISVRSTEGDGKTLGTRKFRVKKVPDPVAVVGSDKANKRGGNISKAVLSAQAGVKAELENFDFDMKFQVVSFRVSATIKGFAQDAQITGAAFNANAKQIIQQVPSGGKVYIEDIKAKGPDGTTRDLGTLCFKVR
jgi:gliding motility-associated protein GldM